MIPEHIMQRITAAMTLINQKYINESIGSTFIFCKCTQIFFNIFPIDIG